MKELEAERNASRSIIDRQVEAMNMMQQDIDDKHIEIQEIVRKRQDVQFELRQQGSLLE